MEGMTLAEVVAAVEGTFVGLDDPAEITPTGGCIDSRDVETGQLFFALPGEQADGHRFIDPALAQGASAAVVSRAWRANEGAGHPGPLIVVAAVDLALGDIAQTYRKRFTCPVVGITGSSGKTTTKDMTAAVLSCRLRVLATEGNLNNQLGVPLTILRLSKDHEVAVIEMGISGHGELKYLCKIADPTIGVITNVGPTHLEFLGSVEGVAQAKGELLEHLDESSMAILNFDDLVLSKERARLKGRLLGFGVEKICQFRGEGLILDQEGCSQFSLQSRNFHLSVPGRHNVYNALAAAAVGSVLDVPIEEAAQALATFKPNKLRSQILEAGGIRLLCDAYNANPASMRAALELLSEIEVPEGGRRVAVMGDMLELGPGAPAAHREVGAHAASLDIDAVFALGSHAAETAEGAISAGFPAGASHAFEARDRLTEALQAFVKPGDLLLLKGSRGLAMESVGQALGFEM
jgi:UDP-N-acetylmuramoyl-tripeptide--D-alanyl-D-alanine ligase